MPESEVQLCERETDSTTSLPCVSIVPGNSPVLNFSLIPYLRIINSYSRVGYFSLSEKNEPLPPPHHSGYNYPFTDASQLDKDHGGWDSLKAFSDTVVTTRLKLMVSPSCSEFLTSCPFLSVNLFSDT